MIASVGVCTRPTVVSWNPPDLELNAVMARVPLMPTSQSDSERHTAASDSPCMDSPLTNDLKPSRIEVCVIDCNQRRCTGCFDFAYWAM